MNDNIHPLVSVIIACYNGEKYIDECLDALVHQTYDNIEIIICDDASTDKSLEKLLKWEQKDSRIKILSNKKNLYAAATRNKCFKEASGDFFCIQDIDDISKLERIEILVNNILTESVDFVSSSMQCFREDPTITISTITPKEIYPTKKNLLRSISFCHPATLFTRKCIEEVNGYRVSPDTRRCQDYDMFMRLYAKGYKGKNIKKSLYQYRLNEDTQKRGTSLNATICEYKVRKYGYKELNIASPIAFFYSLRPWVAFLYYRLKSLLFNK